MFHIVGRSPEGTEARFLLLNDYSLSTILEYEETSMRNHKKRIFATELDDNDRIKLNTVTDISDVGYFNETNRFMLIAIKEYLNNVLQYILCNSSGEIISIPVNDTVSLANFYSSVDKGNTILVNCIMRKYDKQGYRFYLNNNIILPVIQNKKQNSETTEYRKSIESYTNITSEPEDVYSEAGKLAIIDTLSDIDKIIIGVDDFSEEVNPVISALESSLMTDIDMPFVRDCIKNGVSLRSICKYLDIQLMDLISYIEASSVNVDLSKLSSVEAMYTKQLGLYSISNNLGIDYNEVLSLLKILKHEFSNKDLLNELVKEIETGVSYDKLKGFYSITMETQKELFVRLLTSNLPKDKIIEIMNGH